MTIAYALYSQAKSPRKTVQCDRLRGILRTTWVEAAAPPHEWAHEPRVEPNNKNQNSLHRAIRAQWNSSRSWNCIPVRSHAGLRTMTSVSKPASFSLWWRKNSRTHRFNRFLFTARRTCFFGTAIPSLARVNPFAHANTITEQSLDLHRAERRLWKSRRSLTLSSAENASALASLSVKLSSACGLLRAWP